MLPEFQYIYQLSDPRNGMVMYIGCCTNPFYCETRHRSICKTATQPRKKSWVAELRAAGFRPVFKILQKVLYQQAHGLETIYIRSYEESLPGQLLNVVQKRTPEEGILRNRFRNRRKRDAAKAA